MPNMAVAYQRPNRSLTTLRDEVYERYDYTPARASEFVTGYKSPTNFTGHNADANGIVHAIDIFTDGNGNLPEAQGRELAEQLRAIGRATGRFSYLIHDMSPGSPDPRIAGAFSDWEWQPYTGESPHSDHIHVSTVDLYWGDPANFPADVYDSTEPWGIAGITNSGGAVRPIIPKEDDMPYRDWPQADKDAFLKDMYEAVWFGRPGAKLVQNRRLGRGEWPETIIGSSEGRIQREILPPALAGVKATIDPKALAASIPKEIAAQVAAELGKRINNG
ncbi:hypothetical protein [Arthrobacter sp. RCC_34]|uniref:hypothetical protein n=1 Tax=Arthrobacter sp. RCC_34 TaxID=3239230 RepID=UPI003523315A